MQAHTINGDTKAWKDEIIQQVHYLNKKYALNVKIDRVVLFEVIHLWIKEIAKAEQMMSSVQEQEINKKKISPSRVGGYLVFWIRKLKPFYLTDEDYRSNNRTVQRYINELFAIELGFFIIYSAIQTNVKIAAKSTIRLMKSLRYHSMSPVSVSLIFEHLPIASKQ